MVNINSSDIKKLEFVGGGGFGNVYRKGDLIYKIYKDKVPSVLYGSIDNPSLKYHPIRCRRMINLDRKIEKSDLIKDVIFVDGKFRGVVNKYYDGFTLPSIKIPFDKKICLSYDLLMSFRELIDNNVYPLDFKLDNAMVTSMGAKLIDLDDYFTKVSFISNPFYKKKCISILDRSIKNFLHEFYPFYSFDIKDYVDSKVPNFNDSFEGISNYLEDKAKSNTYVILSDDSDLYSHINLFRDSRYRVIYVKNNYVYSDEIIDYLSRLRDMGISVYNVVMKRKLDEFFDCVSYDEVYEVVSDNLVKKM